MEIETPSEMSETPMSSSSYTPKQVEYNSEIYNILIHIEGSEIIFQIESINTNPNKIFNNSFSLEKLVDISEYFKIYNTLNEALEYLNDLLGLNKYTIKNNNDNNNIIYFCFPPSPPFQKKPIEIPLKKKINENDISYNSLSDEMKKIIDQNDLILGIDLGTTYSCGAIMIDQKIIVIENSLGLRTTPSYVSFLSPNERVVGELAKLRPSDEGNVLFNSKRFLGKNINDKEIKDIKNDLPFNLIEDTQLHNIKMCVQFINHGNNKKEYYPEQISAMILKKIVQDAEYYLSKRIGKYIKINKAVVTVPAYFNQKQREATEQASKIINLKIARMINEPTAASLAYGYKTIENNNKYIIVIDFGGGTLDITLLKFMKTGKGVYCDIKYSYGDTHMGGEDFDYILMKKCINEKNFEKNKSYNIRLKRACESAKIKLSTFESTNIILEEYKSNMNINLSITRNQFEKDCSELFKKFENIINNFIKDYKINKNDISEVILIGGSTLIPKVKSIIKNIFSKSEIKTDLNPNEAVAKGAAILGGILSNLSYVNNINLLDVTNLSLGVNVIGNKMSTIIKRSTPIPIRLQEKYQTVEDNQTKASIEIYEGIKPENKDNLLLGKFIIEDLPKKKAGMVKIEIIFDLSSDSILNVKAFEIDNEKNNKELTIKKPKGLSDIMDSLQNEENKMFEIDIKEYSEIKDSILELEEKVLKSEDINKIYSLNESIIEKIGGFIIIILKRIEKEKIVLSYIKYYFKKVSKYLEINNNFQANKNFLKNLDLILQEIQYYNPELIFEIIECFMDYPDIYNKCLTQLIKNYNERISGGFYNINQKLNENKEKKTEIIFDDLLKKLIYLRDLNKTALYLCSKLKKDEMINFKKNYLNYFEDFKLKLEVKEVILKNLQNKLKSKDLIYLNDLIEKYKNCKTSDTEDCFRLESINNTMIENYNRDIKNAEKFNNIFKKMEDDDPEKLYYIFDNYNPNEDTYTHTYLNEFIYYDQKRQEDFLTEIRSKFQKMENQTTEGPIKNAYGEINKYLNKLAQINSVRKLCFKIIEN